MICTTWCELFLAPGVAYLLDNLKEFDAITKLLSFTKQNDTLFLFLSGSGENLIDIFVNQNSDIDDLCNRVRHYERDASNSVKLSILVTLIAWSQAYYLRVLCLDSHFLPSGLTVHHQTGADWPRAKSDNIHLCIIYCVGVIHLYRCSILHNTSTKNPRC